MIKKYSLVLLAFFCSFFYSFGQVIATQDFDGTTPTWSYSSDITFFDNNFGTDGYLGIINSASAAPLSNSNFSGNILAENDLDDEGDNGTTGFANFTFASIDVSAHTNVSITFDYEVIGYNANSDDAKYELFYDTVGQGDVFLLDGNGAPTDASGSVSINVPDAVNDVYIVVSVRNNGSTGYSGFDNFVISTPSSEITVNPTTLTGFTYDEGAGPSVEQNFTVSGTGLTDDIDVTPPTNWEIATTAAGPYQTTTMSFTPSSGTVSTQTLYTRLVAGLLNANSPFSGNITAASVNDGLSETIAVDGTVTIPSSCTPIFTDDFSGTLGAWSNTADWTTTGGELKHNLSGVAGNSYMYSDLGAQNLNAGSYEWEVCIRNDDWTPSSGNRFSYFLLSDDADLVGGSANGYAIAVNFGGDNDDVLRLYEVTNNSYSDIITSSFTWGSDEDVCIRVTRNTAGNWELFLDPNGSGEVSEGTVTDNTHSTGNYIGPRFLFSATRAGRLWLDDVSVCSDVAVSGPELQLVAASSNVSCGYTLDFGNVESDGSTLDLSVFVDNDGSSALDINALTIAGGNAVDFSIISPIIGGSPVSIAPGATQEIVIRFTSNNNGLRTSTLTIDNTDSSDANDETMCTVILNGTGVTNSGGGDLMITQYYEGSGFNKWIEIANVSGSSISAGTYYLATYNKGGAPNYTERPLNGTPNASVSIPELAIDQIIRFKEPATTLPGYAVSGQAGYDGNPTSNMMVASFSGNDIIIISTTNDANSYTNRIDIIGEYSPDGENWGDRRCFIRKECVASNPSITFDIDEWIEFTDAEVETPVNGTNPYLGQHFRGITEYTGAGAFNGWDNGLPDRSRIVEVGDDYLTGSTSIGSFESCSLTINTGTTLDIEDGNYVSILTDLTVDNTATLEVRNEGQLVMIEDSGVVTNNGNTNVRKTTAVMNQYDYVYWSAPIDYDISPLPPLTIDAVLTEFNPSRMYRFNTATYNDADNDTFDDDGNDWANYSSDMIKGVGYATMTANTTPQVNNAIFNGKVNNGIISVNLALSADANGDTDNDEDDWNLVGNPYPSAISADSLIIQNTNINGTIYFWTHNTPISISNPGPDTFNFGTNDYAMYNYSGGVGTGTAASTGGSAPTGHIASGQGFFVDAITATPLTLKISMRSINLSNDDFFRNANDTNNTVVEKDRMWLNLTNSDGAFSQLLVGFFNEATNGKDRLYDGIRLSGTNYIDFYSFDETLHEYGIQGRSSFDENDVIPIGYNSHVLGSLSIELWEREGVLLDTPIYLVDKYLNITHDLTISPYVFTTNDGKFNNRFEVVFTLDSLSDNEFEVDRNALSIIENTNGLVTFNLSGSHTMETVEILDLHGRSVYKLNGDNSSQKTFNLSKLSQSTYIAKVTLDNGSVITKKAIKRK